MMWMQRRSPVVVAGLVGVLVALTAPAAVAAGHAANAPTAGADCQPYAGRPCLFPYPDNRLTVRDRHSITGRRVRLPQRAMPRNVGGVPIKVGPFDQADGFSPGSSIVVHVPGLTSAAAMARTGAVSLQNMAASFRKRAPIVVIDQATGRRQLIWSELDANATSPDTTDLLIHPGRDFLEGHTYVVALRDLRTASGARIASPRWFAQLRRRPRRALTAPPLRTDLHDPQQGRDPGQPAAV